MLKNNRALILVSVILFFNFPILSASSKNRPSTIEQNRFLSARFDPSYYYNRNKNVDVLCEEWAVKWHEAGLNAIYVKVYDPTFGAVYKTDYPLNRETDFGRLNLLFHLINACHQRNIQVFAWIPALQHKHAWNEHPEWRMKDSNGRDYQSNSDIYFLCPRNPDYNLWWSGFLQDLISHYPDLDGVDIGEPIVSWQYGESCYCDHCQKAYGESKIRYNYRYLQLRSQSLTSFLQSTIRLVHDHQLTVSITTVVTALENGKLYSPEQQRELTGFDLNQILNLLYPTDIINIELIWQQWADRYAKSELFTPMWIAEAVEEMVSQIDGRAIFIPHVELTPFGDVYPTNSQFILSLQQTRKQGVGGVDFYDTFQADNQNLWLELNKALQDIVKKRTVFIYESEGEDDAKQFEVLLRHFNTHIKLYDLDEIVHPRLIRDADILFFFGSSSRSELPKPFRQWMLTTDQKVVWINNHLPNLGSQFLSKKGLQYIEADTSTAFRVHYKGIEFPKPDTLLHIVQVTDTANCLIHATAEFGVQIQPYIVQSGRFWFIADNPITFMTEGGRHIVFSDILHDIFEEYHEVSHTAFVRIEDVTPISDPNRLREIADLLKSKNVPFAVGLSPFYLNPTENSLISLSDRPDIVKALHHMVSKGGTIVLHGYTHQYRGQSTIDYEFWDDLNDGPLFEDSEKYVKDRIERALAECIKNNLFPLVWETPHYAASMLDYQVINQYFSTCYERRMTSNYLGTDLLLPYLIPKNNGHPMMIPENLGYVPYDNQTSEPIIQYAKRNLAIRDGYASHYFHPFNSPNVLDEIVTGIQDLGYTYKSIQSLNNKVMTPSYIIASGAGEFTIHLQDAYLHEFYINSKGKIKNRTIGEEKQSGQIKKQFECPPGWMYFAQGVAEKRRKLPLAFWTRKTEPKYPVAGFVENTPVQTKNRTAFPLIITSDTNIDSLSISQESFISAFESVGIDIQTIPVNQLLEIPEITNLIVLPMSSAIMLSEQQTLILIDYLARGGNILLEKESEISNRIGIIQKDPFKSTINVQDEYYPGVFMQWKTKGFYRNFDVDIEYVTYYSDRINGDPLVIGGEYGEGKYLYFNTLFDPLTSMGYARYPYFIDLLQRQFDLWPLVKRDVLEIYFEPGDREKVSIEDLIKSWKKSGFRNIYVAGWHVYANWMYDYGRLIELAHENGMLVYLWLELPHVGAKFWDEHPEWREITATGEEAALGWRKHMALEDEACREAVYTELGKIINQFDWDGINLAELYFESQYDMRTFMPMGPAGALEFTPMHSWVRQDFYEKHNFDPIYLFDESTSFFWRRNQARWDIFEDYRIDLNVKLHHDFLTFFQEGILQNRDREIMVTIMDDLLGQNIAKGIGIDSKRLARLADETPFTLQIEDPQQLWHLGPSRYQKLSEVYWPLVKNGSLILDINIVPARSTELSLAPTSQQTGMEFNQLLLSAMQDSNRVALYSESTIYEVDLPWLAYTMGSHAKERFTSSGLLIEAKNTISIDLDQEAHSDIFVNGKLWPAYFHGKLILPAGKHHITSLSAASNLSTQFRSSLRIVDISSELDSCRIHPKGIEVHYRSKIPNYLIINEFPKKVFVDNKHFQPEIWDGILGYSIRLPKGQHKVIIHTSSGGRFTLKNISLFTSLSIITISSLAVLSLLILYIKRFKKKS